MENNNLEITDQICYLCQRTRPIFMVDTDNIQGIPDRSLSPFLLSLKQDFLNKRAYLQFIKISSQFIQICECSQKICHAYCITAFVLRKQQIYCIDCYHYYRMYVQGQ